MHLINSYLFQQTPSGDDVLFTALVDKATTLGYTLPSANTLSALNTLIKDMRRIGMIQRLDLFHVYASDLEEETDFRLMNIVNPEMIGTSHNNLIWENKGSQGTGGATQNQGYINTRFNPYYGGYNYQQKNASYGVVLYDNNSTSVNDAVIGSSSNLTGNLTSWNRMSPVDNVSHRINNVRGGNNTFLNSVQFSGVGLKMLSRVNINVEAISNHNIQYGNGDYGSLQDENFHVHNAVSLSSLYYSTCGVSCAFAGASIPFEMAQNFRQVYNKYLRTIGLQQVA